MEELFDVVDENGAPQGEIVTRSYAHSHGIRHRTAHIWVARQRGGAWEVLLQKRSMNKESFPGKLDTSAAGHIQAGDEPLPSALRELSEELGINAAPEQLSPAGNFAIKYEKLFHGSMFRDNEVSFVYVYTEPVELEALQLQREEVESVCWRPLATVISAVEAHDSEYCVPYGGIKLAAEWLAQHR